MTDDQILQILQILTRRFETAGLPVTVCGVNYNEKYQNRIQVYFHNGRIWIQLVTYFMPYADHILNLLLLELSNPFQQNQKAEDYIQQNTVENPIGPNQSLGEFIQQNFVPYPVHYLP